MELLKLWMVAPGANDGKAPGKSVWLCGKFPNAFIDVQGKFGFALSASLNPVGLIVAAVAVTTVAITEVIAPGTTEKVIKKISENVIPKVEPIAVPVSNTVYIGLSEIIRLIHLTYWEDNVQICHGYNQLL